MASKSTGTIPAHRLYAEDAVRAIGMLGDMHHWSCTRVNDSNGVGGYLVKITHAGKRVSASRRAWIDAVNAAFEKLQGVEKKPFMRIAR